MLSDHQVQDAIGRNAYGNDGEKIGRVGQIFLDDQTGEPEFATVNTGMFGTSENFVPLAEASFSGDSLTLPYSKDIVKDSPQVDPENGHLSQAEERRLYDYYGLPYSEAASESGLPVGNGHAETTGTTDQGAVGHDTSGPTTDEAMTRSEERLDVGTSTQEAGRARLRKYVETENVTTTVPVRKERAVLETEPITDANVGEATDGPAISEEEHEVVLHEEKPVVGKHAEPVERVRLGKQEETAETQVSEEVRKERIEADGDIDRR
jgi:uncharacterized protein (TIGR02271 family)